MYLQDLTTRLAAGLARLPVEVRARHLAYLLRLQNADGGYSGRLGGSDLYYTAFALRSLAVLDALTPEIVERAAGYLRTSLREQASVVDFFSLLYAILLVQTAGGPDVLADSPADWPQRVAATLDTFRTADGGYGKVPGSSAGSTYHTFLVGLCYQVLGRELPRPQELASFIQSRRREDGGYVEVPPMRRSGTNPTAAAIGVLQLLGGGPLLPGEVVDGVSGFLAEMSGDEGGLRANGRIPFADLLSSFTGVWTLQQLGRLDHIDAAAVLSFAHSLQQPGGGFMGHAWDERTDVEYTFYGLGVLALLSSDQAAAIPP
jgi:geranylgeranyl transferase type-2 subunit beta